MLPLLVRPCVVWSELAVIGNSTTDGRSAFVLGLGAWFSCEHGSSRTCGVASVSKFNLSAGLGLVRVLVPLCAPLLRIHPILDALPRRPAG